MILRHIFWSDWGQRPKIQRAGMDGTSRTIIVDENIYFPNGLTLDYNEWRMYWTDAKIQRINSCNFDGSDRREIIINKDTRLHPFGVTILDDTLYWTDWLTRSVHSFNLSTDLTRKINPPDAVTLMGIVAYDAERQKPGASTT